MNQVVIPMQVFIGDTAELRYSFHNSNAQLAQIGKKDFKTYKEISTSAFCGKIDENSYSIKKVHLIQTGENNYTISVTFIPWKVGSVQLPSYDLSAALFEQYSPMDQIMIDFESVEILSIIEQKGLVAELSAPQNPKLLPGTIYGIYFRAVFIVIVCIILLTLLIKHKSVRLWIKNQRLKRKYRKNKNETLKKLSKALEEYEVSGDEKKIASEIQRIVRKYLEVRFDFPFSNATASEIVSKYYEITLSLLSDEKNNCVEKMGAIFIRTDYIRYATNIADKDKFSITEAKEIIEELQTGILTIETPSEKTGASK